MRLILSSDGLSNSKLKKEFLNLLGVDPKEASLLIITGPQKRSHWIYINEAKDRFVQLGIRKITIANITKEIKAKDFGKFDVILFMGGNTFYLLDRIRKTGFVSYIKNHIRSNRVYVGISAGSMIVSKSVELAGWGKEGDPNLIGLQDLTGLGLVSLTVFPHFKSSLKNEVNLFKKNTDYRIQEIRNGEAVLINGKQIRIVKK